MNDSVLLCCCAHAKNANTAAYDCLFASLAAKHRTRAVPDLCELAARRDESLRAFAEQRALVVLACQPRAVRWLFHAAGAPLPRKARVYSLRTMQPEQVLALLECPTTELPAPQLPAPEQSEWVPWFPVIDYDRCRNCGQCLSFCLFGVYALAPDGRVEVRNPRNCKTYCPACARICPEAAIIFPKCDESPIDGSEIEDEAAVRTEAKENLRKALGSDPYAALARRKAHRKLNR